MNKKSFEKPCPFVKFYAATSTLLTDFLLVYIIFEYVMGNNSIPLGKFIFNVLITIAFSIFSFCAFINPDLWWMLTINHVSAGLLMMLWGEDTISGCLLFFTGWLIAYRFNFFKTARQLKLAALTLMFMCILLAYQFKNGETGAGSSFLLIFSFPELVLIACILYEKAYSATEIQEPANSTSEVIYLAQYQFTQNELYALAATLRDEPYYAISLHLKVSESVVKKMMLNIYARFGCKNRELFLNKISRCMLIYPDEV